MVMEEAVDRRAFLKLSGLGAGAVVLSGGAVIVGTVGRRAMGASATEKVILAYPDYSDVAIGKLADLKEGTPLFFDYPQKDQRNMLVQLGKPAEEGVGPNRDIVAFSVFCAHMGAPLDKVYDHAHGVLGPCPLHYSTFDLAKGGQLVIGKATQPLPQVVLTVDTAGAIIATGMYGLIYGYPANLFRKTGGN